MAPEPDDSLENAIKALERRVNELELDMATLWDKVKAAVGRVYARERRSQGNGDPGAPAAAPDDINERIKQGLSL